MELVPRHLGLHRLIQVVYQVDFNLYLIEATLFCHSRELTSLISSWCTFSPNSLFGFRTLKSISFHTYLISCSKEKLLSKLHTPTHTHTHITHLLRCNLWDKLSHEHNSPLIWRFLVYEEHTCCKLWTFRQAVVYYHSISFAASSFGNRS